MHMFALTMHDFQTLLYSNTNGVLTITMNRPDSYNAFNEAMKKELNNAFKDDCSESNVCVTSCSNKEDVWKNSR